MMKRPLYSLTMGIISVTAAHAFGLPTTTAGPGQYGVPINSVTNLPNIPQSAGAAEICVETAAARYTSDGLTTPSPSVGMPVPAGTCFSYAANMATFRIIGAGATLDVEYFK